MYQRFYWIDKAGNVHRIKSFKKPRPFMTIIDEWHSRKRAARIRMAINVIEGHWSESPRATLTYESVNDTEGGE